MFAEINLAGAAGGVDLALRERVPAGIDLGIHGAPLWRSDLAGQYSSKSARLNFYQRERVGPRRWPESAGQECRHAGDADGINQIGIRAFKQTAGDAVRASFAQEVSVLEIGSRFRTANAVLRLHPPCKPTLAACGQPVR